MKRVDNKRLREKMGELGFERVYLKNASYGTNSYHEFFVDKATNALVIMYDDCYKIRFTGTSYDKKFSYLKGDRHNRIWLMDKLLDIKTNCQLAYQSLQDFEIKPLMDFAKR